MNAAGPGAGYGARSRPERRGCRSASSPALPYLYLGGYVIGSSMHFSTSATNLSTSVMPLLTTCSVQYCLVIEEIGGPPPPTARAGGAFARTSERLSKSGLIRVDILSSAFGRRRSHAPEPGRHDV